MSFLPEEFYSILPFLFKMEKLYAVIGGTLGWWLFQYLLEKFNKRGSGEWNSFISNTVHALVVCRVIEYQMTPWDFNNFGGKHEQWHNHMFVFTMTHFIFDTFYDIYLGIATPTMLVHHLASILSAIPPYYYDTGGVESMTGLWIMEFTQPCYAARWFSRSMGWTRCRMVSEIIFTITFTIMRMFIVSYAFYLVVFTLDLWFVTKLTWIFLHIVNMIFLYQLLKMVWRRISGGNTEKSVELTKEE